MDCNVKNARSDLRQKNKSKHEKFGPFSAKHVRQVEQNLASNAEKKKANGKKEKK